MSDFLIRKKYIREHKTPLLKAVTCSSLFLNHILAKVRSKADEKSKMDLPFAFISKRPQPHASPRDFSKHSQHAHLNALIEKSFLLEEYPELSLLAPPKT